MLIWPAILEVTMFRSFCLGAIGALALVVADANQRFRAM